jgi:TRAP-type mannitol/chloroaromatic compound transport system permease small subunit
LAPEQPVSNVPPAARFLGRFDRLIGGIISLARWLAVPVILLLFLQWPLRDIARAYSREANDLGQWIFALYVAASFTAATRARTHLAADALAQTYSARTRRLIWRLGVPLCLLPWAVFLLVSGKDIVVPSLGLLERFPDTYNPGYFLIKLALWVLAGLVLAQVVVEVARAPDEPERS